MPSINQMKSEVRQKERAFIQHAAKQPAMHSKEFIDWKETSERLAREAAAARAALDRAETMLNN